MWGEPPPDPAEDPGLASGVGQNGGGARTDLPAWLGSSVQRLAGDLAGLAGWVYDLASGEVVWSPELYTVLGYPADEPAPYTELLERFPDPDRSELKAAMVATQRDGTPHDLEVAFDRPDGTRIRLRCVGEAVRDADGEVAGIQGAVQDVTVQHTNLRGYEQLARRLSTTMASVTDAILTFDHDWRFTYLNPRAEQALQRTADSLIGEDVWAQFPAIVGSPLEVLYRGAVSAQQPATLDEYHYAPLGLWLEVRAFPSPDGLTVAFRDISRRRELDHERRELLAAERQALRQVERAHEVLAYKASHDPLTDLYNRAAFVDALTAGEVHDPAVLLIGLDNFRRVNEAYGRAAGDELLLAVAHTINNLCRDADLLGRVGGDQFAIMVAGEGRVAADLLAARLLARLRHPIAAAGQRLYLTASIGIARAIAGEDGERALRDAEVALGSAKQAGPNSSAWYDPVLEHDTEERLATAAELHDALGTDQLTLHFQPNFDLATGRAVSAEALARWHHPTRGSIPPTTFIPAAEDTGLIAPLGDWALRAALEAAAPWVRRDPDFTVWVNVSVPQLRRVGLARTIRELLTATRTAPHQLGIEITETGLASDGEAIQSELLAISEQGVRVAIDDFGTGYSSLSRLAYLPVDVLKIDRSFVAALDTDRGEVTVRAVIALAHGIGASVVAEGVETVEQLEHLRGAGCDLACGFLLARPTPAEGLPDACAEGTATLASIG